MSAPLRGEVGACTCTCTSATSVSTPCIHPGCHAFPYTTYNPFLGGAASLPRLLAQSQVRQPPRLQRGRRCRRATRAWHVHQAAGKLVVSIVRVVISLTTPLYSISPCTPRIGAQAAPGRLLVGRLCNGGRRERRGGLLPHTVLPYTPPWCCTPFIPSYIPLLGLLSLAWHRRHRRWRAAGDHAIHYFTVLQPQTVMNP